MKKFVDYYSILEVDRNSSEEQIHSSYKRLVKIYHPDTETADEDKIRDINEAYSILIDDKKREEYNLEYDYRINNNVSTESDISLDDIINNLDDIDKKILERITFRKILKTKLNSVNKFFYRKAKFLEDSLREDFESKTYNKMQKKLLSDFAKLKAELIAYKQKAINMDMLDLAVEIEDKINYLDQSIKDIPENFTDLSYNDKKEKMEVLLKSKIESLLDDYEYAINELKKLGLSLNRSEIDKEEYVSIYNTLMINIAENNITLKKLEKYLNFEGFENYKEQYENLKKYYSMVSFFVVDYNNSIEKCKYLEYMENVNDIVNEYLSINLLKINKISDIISNHPNNHHSKYLYNIVIDYYEDILKKVDEYFYIKSNFSDETSFSDYKYFYFSSYYNLHNILTKMNVDNNKFVLSHEPLKVTKARPYKGRLCELDGILAWKVKYIKTIKDFLLMYKVFKLHKITDPLIGLFLQVVIWNGGEFLYNKSLSPVVQFFVCIAAFGLAIGDIIGTMFNYLDNKYILDNMKLEIKTDEFINKAYLKK